MRTVVAALMLLMLQKNWQRPGIATNATINEFLNCTQVTEGGRDLRIMTVYHHKTVSSLGLRKVVLEQGEVAKERRERTKRRRIRRRSLPQSRRREEMFHTWRRPVKSRHTSPH